MSRQPADTDGIDMRRAQWSAEMPDVDTVGMAILGRMRRITLSVRPVIEAVFAEHGLDSGEFDVLATLRRSGPPYRLRPTELFKSLMISSGGLTARLNRLSGAALIQRIPAPDDARSLLVELTPKGVSVAGAAFREDMAIERELLASLDEKERAQLETLLRKLMRTREEDRSNE